MTSLGSEGMITILSNYGLVWVLLNSILTVRHWSACFGNKLTMIRFDTFWFSLVDLSFRRNNYENLVVQFIWFGKEGYNFDANFLLSEISLRRLKSWNRISCNYESIVRIVLVITAWRCLVMTIVTEAHGSMLATFPLEHARVMLNGSLANMEGKHYILSGFHSIWCTSNT